MGGNVDEGTGGGGAVSKHRAVCFCRPARQSVSFREVRTHRVALVSSLSKKRMDLHLTGNTLAYPSFPVPLSVDFFLGLHRNHLTPLSVDPSRTFSESPHPSHADPVPLSDQTYHPPRHRNTLLRLSTVP